MVIVVHDNATFIFRELDGIILKIPIVGKQIKTFKLRDGRFDHDDIVDFETHEQDKADEVFSKASDDKNLLEDKEELPRPLQVPP